MNRKTFSAAVIAVSLLLPASRASAATTTLKPIADARVKEAHPNTNYGRSYLRTDGGPGERMQSAFKFSVRVSGTISSATLRLHARDDPTSDGPALHSISNAWTETRITWNNRPRTTGSAYGDLGAVATNSWVSYKVTRAITGNGTYSFKAYQKGTDGVAFNSRKNATYTPRLVVRTGSSTVTPRTTEAVSRAANRLDAMNVPYRLGGGHHTPAVPDPGLDCSSTASWVLQHAGYEIATASTARIPTRWSSILEKWTSSQRGVFVVNHPDPDGSGGRSGHVFLVINGRRFENTSLNNEGAHRVGPYTLTRGAFAEGSHDFVVWHVRGTG